MVQSNLEGGGEGEVDMAQREELYRELHVMAVSQFKDQPKNHTLQPTALVHEAFLKLAGVSPVADRSHFLALAARVMRQVLVDHARSKAASKRGGSFHRITLSEISTPAEPQSEVDILKLEEALVGLSALNASYGRLVELRFFGGLTVEEASGVLGISRTETQRRWRMARAWLERELERETAP